MSKHTPTPWKQYANGATREIMTATKHPEPIAVMERYLNAEDAEFIVKACNSHAMALEALKAVIRHGLIERDGYETVLKQVRSAITIAE